MATVIPFRALRPTPEAAARVAAVPYDVVSTDEARSLAAGNPLSFLHISRAEIDLGADVDPYADAVYARAASNFADLRRTAPLLTEEAPSLYVYRLRQGSHEQTGIAGTFSINEYEHGVILKHERTRRDKEDDRTRHILELRAQTGPVFLVYKSSSAVDAVVERAIAQAPLFDLTAADGVEHTIWRLNPGHSEEIVKAFGDVPALYIADGHHRAASAARARQQLSEKEGTGAFDRFLAVAFPDTQMQILPYNRIVKNLGQHTSESFMNALRERVNVTEGCAIPASKGQVSMYLAGRWYALTLGPARAGPGAEERLDVSRLQEEVLAPMLDIGDVRTDKRIDFIGGARGPSELEKLVDTGKAAVAFSMHPVGVDDLMEISDAGGIMPPKSTWFEPKLRDGLLIHLI